MELKFRSIRVVKTEIPVNTPGGTRLELNYDISSAMEHRIVPGLKDIFQVRLWAQGFFISLMIVSALAAIVYGLSKFFSGMGLERYMAAAAAVYIFLFSILWIIFSLPSVIKNIKADYTRSVRGQGDWRIVDENKWGNFSRMLTLSARRRQSAER
jgi:hypothetical protein